jgi:hypothetical protein
VSTGTYTLSIVALALLVTACGTPERNAWGLPREDVREIARLVRDHTSSPILSYQRDTTDNTSILVFTRGDEYPDVYKAQRIAGRWTIHEAVIIW